MSNEQETQDTEKIDDVKVVTLNPKEEEPAKQLTADGQEIKPYITLNLNPVAKPRMTQSDKWKKRKATEKYWKFKKDLQILCYVASWKPKEDLDVTFVIPMPLSWSRVKREKMDGQPHTSRPDLDNLIKAFKDALLEEDSHVHTYQNMKKIWGKKGQIILKR